MNQDAKIGDVARSGGARRVLLRPLLGAQVDLDFCAPATRPAFEHVRVVQQPIERSRHGGSVAE
jgi:hypothetical protein